ALIGEQHADEQHLAQLELAEAFERARGVRFAAEADLDDVDAGLRHGDDSSRRRIHIMRRIAYGGADRSMPRNAGAYGLHRGVWQRSQHAGSRVLRVYD